MAKKIQSEVTPFLDDIISKEVNLIRRENEFLLAKSKEEDTTIAKINYTASSTILRYSYLALIGYLKNSEISLIIKTDFKKIKGSEESGYEANLILPFLNSFWNLDNYTFNLVGTLTYLAESEGRFNDRSMFIYKKRYGENRAVDLGNHHNPAYLDSTCKIKLINYEYNPSKTEGDNKDRLIRELYTILNPIKDRLSSNYKIKLNIRLV